MKRNNHLLVLVIVLITISLTACAPAIIQPTPTPIPTTTRTPSPTPTPLPGYNTPVVGKKWNMTLKEVKIIPKFQTYSAFDKTSEDLLLDPFYGKPVIEQVETPRSLFGLPRNTYKSASGFHLVAATVAVKLNNPEDESKGLPIGYLKSVESDEQFRLVAVTVERDWEGFEAAFDIVYWIDLELSGIYSSASGDGPQNAIFVFGVTSDSLAKREDFKLEFSDYPELTFFIPREDIRVK